MLRAVRRARRQRQHGGHIGRRYRSVKPPATQCSERNALHESAATKLNNANPNQPVTTERGRTRSWWETLARHRPKGLLARCEHSAVASASTVGVQKVPAPTLMPIHG